jgi:DNA-binding CsgD family transcriptional regulator
MVTVDRAGPKLPILERRSETRALRGVLESARAGNGRLVVIEGEAGIGKSSLLRLAVAEARQAGIRPEVAFGSELERQSPFAAAVALLEHLVHRRAGRLDHLLDGPAAVAAPLFGLGAATSRSAGDPFAAMHGLYWLTLNVLEHTPLLLAVDDAQWADDASLRFFHYLTRRVRELPLALVLAFRTAEGASEENVGHRLRGDREAVHLEPRPLSEDAVGALVAASGQRDAGTSLRRACWEASRGNPFLATELVWELWRERSLRQDQRTDPELLVPERVARFVDTRLSRLDERARRMAEAIAVLGEAATLARAARLAGISEADAIKDVRVLVRGAILDAGGSLRFVHPLVQRTVYESIPGPARRHAHLEAARLLDADAAPVGTVAGHLLETEPAADPGVVEVLRRAAREAADRGQHDIAARILRRALEEPPSGGQQRAVVVELARAEAASGSDAAPARFEEAIGLTPGRRDRAALLLELGRVLHRGASVAEAADAFRRGIDELGARDDAHDDEVREDLAARLEAGLVAAAWLATGDDVVGRAGARIMSEPVLGPARRELALAVAFQRSITGSATAADMMALVHGVLREVPVSALIHEGQAVELATGVMFSTDELDEHAQLATSAIDEARAAGRFGKVGLYLSARGWSDLLRGRLSDAIADTDAAIRAAEVGWEAFYPAAWGIQTMALVERGDLREAARIFDVDPGLWAARADWIVVLIGRGRLLDASGDTTAALAAWREAEAFGVQAHYRNPGPSEWHGWLAEALARRGDWDGARRVADEGVEIARGWGARWPLARALRAAGIAMGGTKGLELLREAASMLGDSPALLERTRALVDLGAALRRAGRVGEAREALTSGMELAHQIGAVALLNRSRDELRAAGFRPRRYARRGVDALTPSEARVARLAAGGKTNREIAEMLFVTPKAVEFHLANAYGKLGIASRQDLPRALAADPTSPAATRSLAAKQDAPPGGHGRGQDGPPP